MNQQEILYRLENMVEKRVIGAIAGTNWHIRVVDKRIKPLTEITIESVAEVIDFSTNFIIDVREMEGRMRFVADYINAVIEDRWQQILSS